MAGAENLRRGCGWQPSEISDQGDSMNILLVSHGTLCQGVADTFHLFVPTGLDVHTLGLTVDGGVEAFRAALDELLERLLGEGDVLVMADLKGGTPYNEVYARLLANPEHLRLVGGLNLPMLIEAGVLAASGGDLETVYQTALTAGAAGVAGAEVFVEDAEDEEADLF